MLLVIELNEARIFVIKYPISLFLLHLKIQITKTRDEEGTFDFDHLHLLLAYNIFLKEIFKIESIVLLYFEPI